MERMRAGCVSCQCRRAGPPASLGSRVRYCKMQSMALVVFLRGCNVGGHKTFRPTLLTEQLKHYDAVNIGATGTFVIRRRTSHARLRADLLRRLPFEAEVIPTMKGSRHPFTS